MFMSEFFNFSTWWLFSLVMMAICIFMMRGRRGAMICGFGSRNQDNHADQESHAIDPLDSPMEILDKRFALGELTLEEYEEKKYFLTHPE